MMALSGSAMDTILKYLMVRVRNKFPRGEHIELRVVDQPWMLVNGGYGIRMSRTKGCGFDVFYRHAQVNVSDKELYECGFEKGRLIELIKSAVDRLVSMLLHYTPIFRLRHDRKWGVQHLPKPSGKWRLYSRRAVA